MFFGRPWPVAAGMLCLALLGASTVPGYALLPPTPAPGPGEFTPGCDCICPLDYAPAPAPDDGTLAPSPHDYSPTPAPNDHIPALSPHDYTPTPAPNDHTPALSPHDYTPTPAPNDHIPAPAPDDYTPTPAPDDYIPAPAPDDYAPAPGPDDYTPAPAPQSPPPYSPFPQPYGPPPPPAQGGAPLLPSPPPGTPSPLGTQCRGVAYDGYLSACTLWIDADSNAVLDADEIHTNITSGSFALDTTQIGAWARVLPARRGLGQASSPRSTDFCFDMATLLPETLPLAAAPYPGQTCLTNITVSPLSTVAAYSGLLVADLRPALGLSGPSPPDFNAYSAAMRGDETALADLAVEISIKNTVLSQLSQLQLGIDNDDLYQAAAVSLFASIGEKALLQLPGRRLAASTFNLSEPDSILDVGSVLDGILPPGLDDSMRQAIAQATATFNALTLSQNSVENVQKASLIAQTLLVGAVDRFVAGNVTAEQFAAATSPQAAQAALASATLGGSLYGDPTPGASTDDGDDGAVNGALVGGLVGGFLGGAILLGLGAYYWLYYRNRPSKKNVPTGTTTKAADNGPPKEQTVTSTEQPTSIDLEAVASPTPAETS